MGEGILENIESLMISDLPKLKLVSLGLLKKGIVERFGLKSK